MTYKSLWIQRLYFGMLKVKLRSISSSMWLVMILIGALPTVYSALRVATRREGQSNILVAQQILSQWTWSCEQLDLSIKIIKDKEKVIIGG